MENTVTMNLKEYEELIRKNERYVLLYEQVKHLYDSEVVVLDRELAAIFGWERKNGRDHV